MIESDLQVALSPDRRVATSATVAYVPNGYSRYAGYLYLLADMEGTVLSVPGIVGGLDESEPDTASAEALIGRPIGPWELRQDGWYAAIL